MGRDTVKTALRLPGQSSGGRDFIIEDRPGKVLEPVLNSLQGQRRSSPQKGEFKGIKTPIKRHLPCVVKLGRLVW